MLGGSGDFGCRVVRALRACPGMVVEVAGRRGRGEARELDLLDYSHRASMQGCTAVVNCSDGSDAPPARAAEFCLQTGAIFVEASADAAVLEALWTAARTVPEPSGSAVLGVGLAPGLSTLLAAGLWRLRPSATRLEVGVRGGTNARTGRSICRTAVAEATQPAPRYEAGQRVADPPHLPCGRMVFWQRPRQVVSAAAADNLLLHWSLGIGSTGALVAPSPLLPLAALRLWALFAPRALMGFAPVEWLLASLLRGWRKTAALWRRGVEISAAVDRDRDEPRADDHARLRCRNAVAAAPQAVAAVVALLIERGAPAGVHTVDRLLEIEAVIERMQAVDAAAGIELTMPPPR